MREKFINYLKMCGRVQDVDALVEKLDKLGFFKAPASTRFHLSREGGLVEHSVKVCMAAIKVRTAMVELDPSLEAKLPMESVIFSALLHDVCKAEIYKQGFRNQKNETTGVWEKVPVFETDYTHCPMGHGEKSVIRLLRWGVELTDDEIIAIRWHMGSWDLPFQSYEEMGNLNAARDKYPLLSVLQAADGLSSGLLEQ